MVDGLLRIEVRQSVDIAPVERVDPREHERARLFDSRLSSSLIDHPSASSEQRYFGPMNR
jgi:hypothetical protein